MGGVGSSGSNAACSSGERTHGSAIESNLSRLSGMVILLAMVSVYEYSKTGTCWQPVAVAQFGIVDSTGVD